MGLHCLLTYMQLNQQVGYIIVNRLILLLMQFFWKGTSIISVSLYVGSYVTNPGWRKCRFMHKWIANLSPANCCIRILGDGLVIHKLFMHINAVLFSDFHRDIAAPCCTTLALTGGVLIIVS